jgi:hypothetical protein
MSNTRRGCATFVVYHKAFFSAWRGSGDTEVNILYILSKIDPTDDVWLLFSLLSQTHSDVTYPLTIAMRSDKHVQARMGLHYTISRYTFSPHDQNKPVAADYSTGMHTVAKTQVVNTCAAVPMKPWQNVPWCRGQEETSCFQMSFHTVCTGNW